MKGMDKWLIFRGRDEMEPYYLVETGTYDFAWPDGTYANIVIDFDLYEEHMHIFAENIKGRTIRAGIVRAFGEIEAVSITASSLAADVIKAEHAEAEDDIQARKYIEAKHIEAGSLEAKEIRAERVNCGIIKAGQAAFSPIRYRKEPEAITNETWKDELYGKAELIEAADAEEDIRRVTERENDEYRKYMIEAMLAW